VSNIERKKYIDVATILKASSKAAVLAVAETGAGRAAALAPVDTGNLRSSISAKSVSDTRASYGSNVEYAPYIEFGTRHMAAQPYLRPSADWLRKNGSRIFAKVLKGALRRGLYTC